jgi:hypothetical protein
LPALAFPPPPNFVPVKLARRLSKIFPVVIDCYIVDNISRKTLATSNPARSLFQRSLSNKPRPFQYFDHTYYNGGDFLLLFL